MQGLLWLGGQAWLLAEILITACATKKHVNSWLITGKVSASLGTEMEE